MPNPQETEVLNGVLARWRSAIAKLEVKNAGAARTNYREVAVHTPPFGERLGAIIENEPAKKLLASLLAKSEAERDVANFMTLALCDAAVLVTETDTVSGLCRVLGVPDTAFTSPDAQAQLKSTLGAQTAFPFMSVRGTRSLPTLAPMFPVEQSMLVDVCRALFPRLGQLGGEESPTAFEEAAKDALADREETAPEQKSVAVGQALRQLYALHRHLQANPGKDLNSALKSFAQKHGWEPQKALPFPIAEVWDELCGLPSSRPLPAKPKPKPKEAAPPPPPPKVEKVEPPPPPPPPKVEKAASPREIEIKEPDDVEATVATNIETMNPAQLIVEIFRGRIAKFPDGSDAKEHSKLPANQLPWGLYRTIDGATVLVCDTELGLNAGLIVELLNTPYDANPGAALVKVGGREWVLANWPFDLDLKMPSVALQGSTTAGGPIRRWARVLDGTKRPPFLLARRDSSIERMVRVTEQGATWTEGQLPAASAPRIYWRLMEYEGGLRPTLFVHVPPETGAQEARVTVGDVEEVFDAWAKAWSPPLVDVAPDAKVTVHLDGKPNELRASFAPPALFAPMSTGKGLQKASWKDLLTRRTPLVMVVDARAQVSASDAMLEPVDLKGPGWDRFRAMRIRPQIGQIADIRVDNKKTIDFPLPAVVRLGAEGGTGTEEVVLLTGDPVSLSVSGFLGDAMKEWGREGRVVLEYDGKHSEEKVHAADDIFTWSIPVSQLQEKLGLLRKPSVITASLKDVKGVAARGPSRIQFVPMPRLEVVGAPAVRSNEKSIAVSVKIEGGAPGVAVEVGDPVEKRWVPLVPAADGIASVVVGRPADRTLPTVLALPLRVHGIPLPAGLPVHVGDAQATAGMPVREQKIDATLKGSPPTPPPVDDEMPTINEMSVPDLQSLKEPPSRTAAPPPPPPPPAKEPVREVAPPPPPDALPADPKARAKELLDQHDRGVKELTGKIQEAFAFKMVQAAELASALTALNSALAELKQLMKAAGAPDPEGAASRADIERGLDEALKERDKKRRASHIERIARELETGKIEHRLKKREEQLETLRADALAQLSSAMNADDPPELPIAQGDGEWLAWTWSLVDPMLSETLDKIRGATPALARFLEEVEPAFWKAGR